MNTDNSSRVFLFLYSHGTHGKTRKEKTVIRDILISSSFVIPAQAGIQQLFEYKNWIPGLRCASPGMTI